MSCSEKMYNITIKKINVGEKKNVSTKLKLLFHYIIQSYRQTIKIILKQAAMLQNVVCIVFTNKRHQ